MLNRLRRAWELSKEAVSNEKLRELLADEPLGDGNAAFLGEGTHEEFEDYRREEKGFKHIFGIGL